MVINSKDIKELPDKILLGIQKAVQELIERSAANNETLVISDKEGNIKKVPARELLKDSSE